MENSKRKFWAREILIFWTSLLAMFLIYLIVLGWVKVSNHFTNKSIKTQNEKIQSTLDYIKAEDDSLAMTPQFISTLTKEGSIKEEKRQKLYNLLTKERLYTKTFDEFKADYGISDEAQKFLHENLAKRGYDKKTFDEFQENFFGDMLAINPEWEKNQKLIQENRTKWNELKGRKRTFRSTDVLLELFALAWFVVVYPLRGIVFSILWAYRTLKEK